jgi:hypothetical protein
MLLRRLQLRTAQSAKFTLRPPPLYTLDPQHSTTHAQMRGGEAGRGGAGSVRVALRRRHLPGSGCSCPNPSSNTSVIELPDGATVTLDTERRFVRNGHTPTTLGHPAHTEAGSAGARRSRRLS